MSRENVDVVRAAFEATGRRDREAFGRLHHPEIEWEDASGLWGGTRHGIEDIEDAFRTWFEAFERVEFDLDRVVDAGDHVIAFVRVSGRGRESGLVIDQVRPQVWTVHGGRVVRVRAYQEEAEALAAAGLPQRASREPR